MNARILSLGLSALILSGCNSIAVRGHGEAYDVSHEVNAISAVEVSGSGELRIQNGDRNELIVLAQEDIHAHLSIRERAGRLIIEPEEGYHFKTEAPLQYLLITDGLTDIIVSGAVNVTSDDYRTSRLHLDASGATDIDMTVTADQLSLDAAGAFDGYLSGEVDELTLDLAGASELNAYDLIAGAVDIDVSGASTLYVYAQDSLNVTAAGASKVTYRGQPRVSQSAAGASSVRSAD